MFSSAIRCCSGEKVGGRGAGDRVVQHFSRQGLFVAFELDAALSWARVSALHVGLCFVKVKSMQDRMGKKTNEVLGHRLPRPYIVCHQVGNKKQHEASNHHADVMALCTAEIHVFLLAVVQVLGLIAEAADNLVLGVDQGCWWCRRVGQRHGSCCYAVGKGTQHAAGQGPPDVEHSGHGGLAGELDLQVIVRRERVGRVPVQAVGFEVCAERGLGARGEGEAPALDVFEAVFHWRCEHDGEPVEGEEQAGYYGQHGSGGVLV